MSRGRDDIRDRGRSRGDEYRERSEDRRRDLSYQNHEKRRSCGSVKAGVGLRDENVERFSNEKQRREYSRSKDEERIGRRKVDRKERSKEQERENSREKHKREGRDHSRSRNLDDHRIERSYQNMEKLRTPRDERRKDFKSGGVGRIDRFAVPSEGRGKSDFPEKKTCDEKDIRGLILSIFNRTKQMDNNGNVVWDQEVWNDLQGILNENPGEENNFKDYSYQEFSGLLPKSSRVEDRRHEEDSELEESSNDGSSRRRKLVPGASRKREVSMTNESRHRSESSNDGSSRRRKLVFGASRKQEVSITNESRHRSESSDDGSSKRRKLVPGASRKREVSMTNESRHRSRSRSSSTDGPNNLDCRNDDEDIDDDYMIYIMKNVVSQNDKCKQTVEEKVPITELGTAEDSEAKMFKAPKFFSPSTHQADSSHFKTALDSNISSELKVKTDIEMTCGSRGEGMSFSSLSCLPSPRPASVSAHHDSDVEPKFVPEAVSVCSTSLYKKGVEQNQLGGWKRSPGKVCFSMSQRPEAEECQPLTAEFGMSLPHNVPTVGEVNEGEVVAIPPEEDIMEKVLTQKKIIIVDAENEISEVKKEEKYEEPSPEIFEHVDLRANTRFTPITQRMHQVITSAMLSISEVVLSRHNIDITKHDLFTLTGDNWLNDQVVEMFLTMIAQRSSSIIYVLNHNPKVHSMSTYFFTNLYTRGYSTIKKWTKEVDIFTFDIVLVPIHMDSHWSLATIDFRVPGVFYYDSLGSSVNDNVILSALLHYLSKEHMDKKGEEINLSKFAKHAMDTPLQQNGSDCGVFCCKVGDSLSRDLQLDFSQEDIKYFRKRMIFEILRGVLLEP